MIQALLKDSIVKVGHEIILPVILFVDNKYSEVAFGSKPWTPSILLTKGRDTSCRALDMLLTT